MERLLRTIGRHDSTEIVQVCHNANEQTCTDRWIEGSLKQTTSIRYFLL